MRPHIRRFPRWLATAILLAGGLGLASAAAPADLPPLKEPAKDVAAQLEKLTAQIKELELQIRQLQDKESKQVAATKAEQEAAAKYMHAVAENFLDAMIGRNPSAMAVLLSKDYRTAVAGAENTKDAHTYLLSWGAAQNNNDLYKAWSIDTEIAAPGKDEITFRGTVTGKDAKGTFNVTVSKDKESGRYLVCFFNIKAGK
jgi:hypothetical protein